MKIQLTHKFEDIICVENLLEAWKEFLNGKRNKKDVQEFSMRLMDNIFSLHNDLINHTYKHGGYQAFKINDPKPRDIHKATVRDRLLHHAIYRILYPFFDKTFIADSYSCRLDKGTHKAVNRFREFAWKASRNNTKTCWVLKCDIRKFFANIDHEILLNILKEYITDEDIIELLANVIDSFISSLIPLLSHPLLISPSGRGRGIRNIGLPLGNLTSQLFVNIYMNKFDQFAKHNLRIKHYLRYCDDFIILSENENYLKNLSVKINDFLRVKLKLTLHPNKIIIRKYHQGIDWLGYVVLPRYRALRTKTKRRMLKRIAQKRVNFSQGLISAMSFQQSLQSYFGVLKHCQGHKIRQEIENLIDGGEELI